ARPAEYPYLMTIIGGQDAVDVSMDQR
mgnify:CR=1